MSRVLQALVSFFVLLFLANASCVLAKERLLVYTAVEPEFLTLYKEAFEKENPDIEITYVRDSAGPISARLMAEKGNPKADVILGLSAIALERLNLVGLLDSYSPRNASAINSKMRARDFSWFGINAWGGSICVNTELMEKYQLPVPKTWDDLLNPIYKGRIVMPNPVASSTGFMFLMGWLQAKGEKAGWRYIEKLHENILFYTASGARPAAMAAQGEIPIALTSEAFVRPFMRFSVPVITVEPQEGIAWDAEGCALPKGSPHPVLAKRFLDFCASQPVADIAASFSGISSIDRYSTETGKKLVARFLTLDFRQAAVEKKAITDQWQSIASR